MLDDERDSAQQRYQLIGMIALVVLVVAWSYFFFPNAPRSVPPTQDAPQSSPAPAEAPPETAPEEAVPVEPEAPPETAPEEAVPVEPEAPPETAPASSPDVTDRSVLPPVAGPEAITDADIILRGGHLELVLTPVGGRIKQATVILGDDGSDSVELVPYWRDTPDADAVYPMGLRFSETHLGDELDRRQWEAEVDEAGRRVTFALTMPGLAKVVKSFRMTDTPHLVEVSVEYTNLEDHIRLLGMDQVEPAFSLNWGPNVSSEDEAKGVKQQVVWRKNAENTTYPTQKLELPKAGGRFSEWETGIDWAAIKSAYFAVGIKPEFENAQSWIWGTPEHFRLGVGTRRFELAPGEAQTRAFKVYVGPMQTAALAKAWPGFETVLQFFTMFQFMDKFAKLLLGVLNWFYAHVFPNYGFAIIFLTVLVRMVMFPLTIKSMKSMKKMQKLAPEMERLKAEYGDDQQEVQKRTMELYRERGVNPIGGCFPILLQMPIFIALYRMLWSAFELRRAPFLLWMTDLAEPDRLWELPYVIPFPFSAAGITHLNLLPILMGAAMVMSQKLTPASGAAQNPQQKMMMTMMPAVFCVICYNMASGLNLYILVSTLLGIAQNYLVHVSDVDVEPKKPKKAASRPRHFYTAAQARKRQLAKEIRRDKKTKQRRDSGSGRSAKKRP